MIGFQLQAEGDVLLHGQPGEHAVFLEDDATLRAGSFDRVAVEQHLAGGRLLEAGQHAHHRGLAAAGRTDHGDEVAVIDVVGDILDDPERALRRTRTQATHDRTARA